MKKVFHITSTFEKSNLQEDGSITIKGLASTNALDRTGDIIDHNAWKDGGLDNYGDNPIILFNHDYNRPIGRAKYCDVTQNGLELEAKISKSAGDIVDLIKDGVLGAFSVGFKVKDADYNKETDGFFIKSAELLEVSVVSIPANQTATFSIAKSFDNDSDYEKFKSQFNKAHSVESVITDKTEQPSAANAENMEKDMSKDNSSPEFDLKAFAEEVAKKTATTIAMQQAEQKAKEDAELQKSAELEAEAKAVQEAKEDEQKTIIEAGLSGAEKLVNDVEQRLLEKNESLHDVVAELQKDLAEKSEEILSMRESKRVFSGRGNSDWKTTHESEIMDAKVLSVITGQKGIDSTSYGQSVIEKVNTDSGVAVSSADFEQVVSTGVERDIQNELVLAPLFREVPMTSASMIMPILPDAGYAEFVSSAGTGDGASPHGNLSQRGDTYVTTGDRGGIDLTEKTITVKKLISKSFIGNETEEDAIMPILPLIRESMVRAHARGIENAILFGNNAQGTYTSGIFDGLVHKATDASNVVVGSEAAASDKLTSLELLEMRKNMGKYGVNPQEVVYIVSQEAYYNLLEDANFQDVNLVGDMATKLSGEIGQVFGSRVLICDEFQARAVNKTHAVALYARNFIMPRLRGVTIESDYDVENQRRVLVASQRLGFDDIIGSSDAVVIRNYKSS
jgi:HK97 family phage prohead protease|tara:strand:- start:361 stop:2394 length:2034 start_codon:yes stop_codon:yes gene_type:complete